MPKEKLSVLLVEDNPTDALIVKKRMQRDDAFDYEIIHVASGEEALLNLERSRYDVMLLDYNLPKKSGLETLREIKARHIEMLVVVGRVGSGKEEIFQAYEGRGL